MPDEKDLHDLNNPIYSKEKSWHEKQIEEHQERIAKQSEEVWALGHREEGKPVVSPEFKKRQIGAAGFVSEQIRKVTFSSEPDKYTGKDKLPYMDEYTIKSKDNETKK